MPRTILCIALSFAAWLPSGCSQLQPNNEVATHYLEPGQSGVTASTLVGLHSWNHYDDPADSLLPAKILIERRWNDQSSIYVSAERRVVGAPTIDSEHFHEFLLGSRTFWYPVRGFRLYQNLGLGYREPSRVEEGLALEFGFGIQYSRGQWHWDLQVNKPLHQLFTDADSVDDRLEVGLGVGFRF